MNGMSGARDNVSETTEGKENEARERKRAHRMGKGKVFHRVNTKSTDFILMKCFKQHFFRLENSLPKHLKNIHLDAILPHVS